MISGRRLVLTYNLIHSTLTSRELGADSSKTLTRLDTLFSSWNTSLDDDLMLPSSLAFMFEHQYTESNLWFDSLQGKDKQAASYLRDLCRQHGFCFYLADVEMKLEERCNEDTGCEGCHEIEGKISKTISLSRVSALDGSNVAVDLDFEEEFFIQADPFGDLDRDDEKRSGYTGNKGFTTTHYYQSTVRLPLQTKVYGL